MADPLGARGGPAAGRRVRQGAAALALVALGATGARAQQPADTASASLVGQIVSSTTGEGLAGAVVSLQRARVGSVSDSAGRFRIPVARSGQDTVVVRYVGYEESRLALYLRPGHTTRAVLLLSPQVVRLADLRVEIEREPLNLLSGFERRRKKGIGHYITFEEIQKRKPRYTTDMLRRVPGLRIGPVQGGKAEVQLGRNATPCLPPLFIDGIYYRRMGPDDVIAPDLGAIEVYTGASQLPAEFAVQAPSGCGAILIWTRRSFMREGEPGR